MKMAATPNLFISRSMSSKLRTLTVNLLKIFFAAALVYWLVQSGKLHFENLTLYIRYPQVTLLAVLGFVFLLIGCGGFRWYLLLRGQEIYVPFFKVIQLQMIGFFFNTAMPGAVSGDIVKAFYLLRDQKSQAKTPAMLTILIDRAVGLMSLFFLGTVAILFNSDVLLGSALLRPMAYFVLIVTAIILVAVFIVFYPHKGFQERVDGIFNVKIVGFGLLKKIFVALCAYRQSPQTLLLAVAIGLAIQGFILVFFLYLTDLLMGSHPDFWTFAAVYPIGSLVTALPISPGGLGVGHVAFDKIYGAIGQAGGADVFNVYILGLLCLNLTGGIPYVLYRREKQKSSNQDIAKSDYAASGS
jgi:glycosyltransferase 2 family protein